MPKKKDEDDDVSSVDVDEEVNEVEDDEAANDLANADVVTKYQTAGKIANECLAKVIAACVPGTKAVTLCLVGDEVRARLRRVEVGGVEARGWWEGGGGRVWVGGCRWEGCRWEGDGARVEGGRGGGWEHCVVGDEMRACASCGARCAPAATARLTLLTAAPRRPSRRPPARSTTARVRTARRLTRVPPHGQSAPPPPFLAVAGLGACATSGHAWRL